MSGEDLTPRRAAVAIFLAAAPLFAHDFWIEPSTFRPEVGTSVGIALRVGEGFRGDPVARAPGRISRFVLVSPSRETPIEGVTGHDPAGVARVSEAGLQIVGYRSKSSKVELEAEKFEEYLKEEGLERIVAERARRGESAKPSREIYSRCAKAILAAGGGGAGKSDPDRVLGFTLELVPEKNPYASPTGGSFPVRLEYGGRPLAGALVVALNRAAPEMRLSARTDSKGRVSFALAKPGAWLVKSVHMVRAPAKSGADWESLWASLTFEIP
ncbi:MAG: DUF4198 domain-containing protein [Acidobacteriota bacterium]|nr:DUF4198 domain-containing protein [Acidobacteriota bacterium]MDQ5871227.1 DUF4198 domain-containing protein [Acidobacteriota bacterium]